MSYIQQKNRDFEKEGDVNQFDFNNIDQHSDENNLNQFFDLFENSKTKYDRTPIFDVIVDSQRDDFPFTLNVEFNVNDGEPFQVNRFYKDSNQLTNSIEKRINKYDETLEVLLLVYMIEYTMVFNQIKLSNYGKGCDACNSFLEYEG